MRAIYLVISILLLSACEQDTFKASYPLNVVLSDDLGDERIEKIITHLDGWNEATGHQAVSYTVVHGEVETPCNSVQVFASKGIPSMGRTYKETGVDQTGEHHLCARRIALDFEEFETRNQMFKVMVQHEVGHVLLGLNYDNEGHDELPNSIMHAVMDPRVDHILPEHAAIVLRNMGVPDYIVEAPVVTMD